MNIIQNINQNQTNPVFKGHALIDLKNLTTSTRNQLLKAIKSDVGDGIVKKSYKFHGDTHKSKIFVGFEEDLVVIATGNDNILKTRYGAERATTKFQKIDMRIFKKISKILDSLGIENPQKIVKKDHTISGEININKYKNKVSVQIVHDNGYATHNYKNNSDNFEHTDTISLLH